jgi:hypothetical protein
LFGHDGYAVAPAAIVARESFQLADFRFSFSIPYREFGENYREIFRPSARMRKWRHGVNPSLLASQKRQEVDPSQRLVAATLAIFGRVENWRSTP